MKEAEKKRLIADIKQLKEEHKALEITHMRYNKSMRVLVTRVNEIEKLQLGISVEIWRKENEAGIEQLEMF